MTIDKIVLDFFRKKAEQIVEREYSYKIYKIKTNISKKQSQLIDKETKKLQKEWESENKEKLKLLLEQFFERHANEYEKALRLLDLETKSGFIFKEDSELISNINEKDFESKIGYNNACRHIIRSNKNKLRAWKLQKRKERIKFVQKNKLSQEQIEKKFTQENQDTFEVFKENEIKRQDILKKEMDCITVKFTQKQKTEIELFQENWNKNKENKIYAIIKDIIRKDEEIDIHTVFQERVDNEWNVHRKNLFNSKLLYILQMTEANTYKINKKYEVIIEDKIKKCNENLRVDLKNIESNHTKYYDSIITNYKNGIIKELESQEIKIKTFSSQSDYEKFKRNANKDRRNLIRNKQKQLRKITLATIDLLPEYIKSQLKNLDVQIINEKNRTQRKYEKQIVEMKQFYEKCRIKEASEDKVKIEEIEKNKVITEIDSLEQKWKSSQKEESVLLNKVKYNDYLEIKLLEKNQLLSQKEKKISNLKIKINELTETVRKQTKELNNFEGEKRFLKKIKEKYFKDQVANKKKSTKGVWGRHTIIDEPTRDVLSRHIMIGEPKTIEDFQEIEKKLLMKSVLREKGPIFEHVYKCNGIYRDESDLEILFKAEQENIINIKYEYKFNTISIDCFGNKIDQPFVFKVNKFFCIKFKIVNKFLSIQIDDINLGSWDIPDPGLLNQLDIRLKSNKSIFYHHFIKPM